MRGNGDSNCYYVYALVDPRSGDRFYIGKGKGRRAYQHEAEIRRGRCMNAHKGQRILDIIEAGLTIQYQFLSTGLSEAEAWRIERAAIAADRTTLTNLSPGSTAAVELVAVQAQALLARMKPRHLSRDVKIWDQIHACLTEIAEGGPRACHTAKVRQVYRGGQLIEQSVTYA